ncbi:MAG: hypothetical protein E5W70_26530 [Mesorhizobium sp.]|nr:MAG: hypothetical protein E5W70_26530 [Mesorhizobium sp.]
MPIITCHSVHLSPAEEAHMIDRMNIDSALYPTDLEALKSVFIQICEEGHVEPGLRLRSSQPTLSGFSRVA